MTNTQPTATAMEAADLLRNELTASWTRSAAIGTNHARDTIAAAFDAYAAERIEEATDGDRTFARLAQVERERDAALAKLETVEASLITMADANKIWRDKANAAENRATARAKRTGRPPKAKLAAAEATIQGLTDDYTTLEMRHVAAEERVRVLESSIDLALRFMPQHEPHTKILRDSRNAKAAADEGAAPVEDVP